MRVIHICQRDNPDTGGSLRVAEALLCEQLKLGYEVWVLFLYGHEGCVAQKFPGHTLYLGLASSRQALSGVYRLGKIVKKINPDVIHSHDGITWPRLAYLLLHVHPVVMHTHLPVSETNSLFNRCLIRLTTDLLCGISLHTIETWVKAGFPPSRIHFTPNGVDAARFRIADQSEVKSMRIQLELPPDKHILLWVGRLHRTMKGSDRVERVARLLPADMMLVVVGNGPEYDGIMKRCSDLIAQKKLVMTGSLDAPADYYMVADEFIFTSYYEPFGLVILEAAASGLPIYSFPVLNGGGAVELLSEFHAVALDDSMSNEQLSAMLDHSGTRPCKILENREKTISSYSWSRIAEQVEYVYRIALAKQR